MTLFASRKLYVITITDNNNNKKVTIILITKKKREKLWPKTSDKNKIKQTSDQKYYPSGNIAAGVAVHGTVFTCVWRRRVMDYRWAGRGFYRLIKIRFVYVKEPGRGLK